MMQVLGVRAKSALLSCEDVHVQGDEATAERETLDQDGVRGPLPFVRR